MDGTSQEEPKVDNICTICMDQLKEKSCTQPCCHEFCYPCITNWTLESSFCPVCRAQIISIYHSIKSDTEYQVKMIEHREPDFEAIDINDDIDDEASLFLVNIRALLRTERRLERRRTTTLSRIATATARQAGRSSSASPVLRRRRRQNSLDNTIATNTNSSTSRTRPTATASQNRGGRSGNTRNSRRGSRRRGRRG